MKKVTIYTTQSCGYCKMAKAFLAQNNIQYTERDIERDAQAREELIQRNINGVPVFFIGNELIVGFDKEKILALVDHRIATCPACQGKMRLPSDKGKLRVSCPNCKNTFEWTP